jgi:hypothetical protein
MSRESIIPQMAIVDSIELSTLFWRTKIQSLNYLINSKIIVLGESKNDLHKCFIKI